MNNKTNKLALAGIIAALYVILTMITSIFGASSGLIQIRLSEALCILAAFTPAAIPGLSIGCLIANILSGLALWDIIFGSIATLIGAIGTWLLRKNRILACLPPVIANTLIIPPILILEYGISKAYIVVVASIFLSELISCLILGQIVYKTYQKIRDK